MDESLSEREARLIVGVRYELHSRDSYTFAEDVSTEVLSLITDGRYEGVTIRTASARVYNTALAAHILGTIGPIWQEEWSSNEDTGYVGYADKGYSMNDLVGKDGVEKAFESYLRGTDGRRLITTDETGKITGELYTREPQPGGTVALTLDIDLQADVEAALAETISGMIDKDSNERGGAAAVVSVGTGEVLALASYPTYDLSTFNEDYDELVNDQRLPMFNRATQGIYAPGSTFKMVTAVAALESGIITPSSIIQDRGIYTYYKDPQPMCWIYSQTGSTHGRINVSQAITDSCNYFSMRWGGSPVSGHWTATPLSSGWGSPPALKLATPAACWPPLSGRKATIRSGPTARPLPPPSASPTTCLRRCSWPTTWPRWWAAATTIRLIC